MKQPLFRMRITTSMVLPVEVNDEWVRTFNYNQDLGDLITPIIMEFCSSNLREKVFTREIGNMSVLVELKKQNPE